MRIVSIVRIIATLLVLAIAPSLGAQSPRSAYPDRPITMVIGYPPGGGADALGRIVAVQMGAVLQKPISVVNRSGAGGTIGAAYVAASAPDGYTIFFAESSLLVAPHIYTSLSFDLKGFTPIAPVGSLPFAIVSSPQFPAKTLIDLISLLRERPEAFSYASPGIGNIGHLSAEMFQQLAGVKLVHIPFQGGGKLIADVMSGEIPLAFLSVSPVLPLVRAGRLNMIAITSPTRVSYAPTIPTVSEALPGFVSATNFFVLAPAHLPPTIRDVLSAAVKQALATKDVEEAFSAQGASLSPGTAAELASQMAVETARWGSVVKAGKITSQ